MPWQRLVADVGGELVEDPETGLMIPAYRDVVFTVPRQNGKTTLVLGWECQRAIGWDLGPQRIAYSAQTGADARKKLIHDQKPILDRHKRALDIRRIYEAIGGEGVVWNNGSRLTLLNNTEAGGHGPTVDLGVKDELFADYDDRRDQALVPAMNTRPAAQVIACSTAGTEASVPWNAEVDRGRLAVDSGARTGVAYFEWSAAADDDLDDPDVWWSFMPALGYTITQATIAAARTKFADRPGEFVRAYGNRKTSADERVLPEAHWNAVTTATASPEGKPVFALDVNPERSAGAITAASPDVAELVEYRLTTSWLVPRAVELSERWSSPWWVVDASGPAASLIGDMERAGLRVHPTSPAELVKACGQMLSGVIEHTIAIRQHQRLDEAAAGAAKRTINDAFAWARKSAAADICPLVAATLALWGAKALPDEAAEPFMVVT